jgi:hypothetical protein
MGLTGVFRLEDPALVVVSNYVKAAQWRSAVARSRVIAGQKAWMDGDVLTLEQWVQRCWETSHADR